MQPTSPALEPSPEKGHTTFVEAGCRAQSHTSNHSVEPALEK
jgi:hypothetical protein